MSTPELRRHGDTFDFVWRDEAIGIGLERIQERREGLIAEITVESTAPAFEGHVHGPAHLNLLSTESQHRLAKVLGERVNHIDWAGMLLTACNIAASRFREPPPVVDLSVGDDPGPVKELLAGVPKGETIVTYGDGESAKSLFDLLIGVAGAAGVVLPWGARIVERLTVMVLDFETTENTVKSRFRRICRGFGLTEIPKLHYREMHQPLVDAVDVLRGDRDRLGIDLFIVDSLSFACNGSLNDDDVARGLMNALRRLSPATRLCVAHVSQESARATHGSTRPFGSAFFWNGMRSGWEIRKAEESPPNTIDLGVYHRKTNDLSRERPFAVRVQFDGLDGPITFSRGEVGDSPDLIARTPLSMRIRAALRAGALDTHELAEEAGVADGTIRSAVRRMPDVVQLSPGRSGRGTAAPAVWGLGDGH